MVIASLSNTRWTIGVCTTVQIGERGTFTDVQIGERGKQSVKEFMKIENLVLQLRVIKSYSWPINKSSNI